MKDMVSIKMHEYMTSRKLVIATGLPGLVKESEQNNGVLDVDRLEQVLKLPEEQEEGNTIQSEGIKTRKSVQSSS